VIHSRRSIRRVVLERMWDILDVNYGSTIGRQDFVDGAISRHEIDGILCFKGDSHLEELRNALIRIEQGTYGVCIGCKRRIPRDSLYSDPTRRMCPECEQRYTRASMRSQQSISL
jgi:RNA polymerase-binding transcription factor DksA